MKEKNEQNAGKISTPEHGTYTSPVVDKREHGFEQNIKDLCYWGGRAYSNGATICVFDHPPSSYGTIYKCDSGQWVITTRSCP